MNTSEPNKNNFFQTKFQEIGFSRSMSFCSFFAPEEKDIFNLDLEIEDVIQFDHTDLENYRVPLFNQEMSRMDDWANNEFDAQQPIDSVEIKSPSLKEIEIESKKSDRASQKVQQIESKKGNLSKSSKAQKIVKQTNGSSNLLKKEKTKKPQKTFYEKNICRNIIRKMIRGIQAQTHKQKLLYFCKDNSQFYQEFKLIMVSHLELITGPAALKDFLLVEDDISKILKKYTKWYLKERYIRDALQGGQMNNVDKYIEFKNKELLPLLDKL